MDAHAEAVPPGNSVMMASKFRVLGVTFFAVQIPDVIQQMQRWISAAGGSHYICVSNVHSIVESQYERSVKATLNNSDLNVPDGMPVVWMGRLRGHELSRRVYGPELFEHFLRETQGKQYKHFFYGGSSATLDALMTSLKDAFPGLQIAGKYSPPFRPLTPEEESNAVEMINAASPDVLWIGLGCPKQELWMREHRDVLNVPVMVGIGQAFNIYAGTLKQAPRWMRESGLEWLFRLCLEPRRLWRRYLVYNTLFLYYVFLEFFGLKSFE
jgi:N-acetylglucosaminyldiphosphoundecaprenol N-acetyl-beta-D-mannosaminyltransferase